MSARRCTICAHNFPNTKDFKYCPICEEETQLGANLLPMDPDEAKSLKLHADFERYYEQREATRVEPEPQR